MGKGSSAFKQGETRTLLPDSTRDCNAVSIDPPCYSSLSDDYGDRRHHRHLAIDFQGEQVTKTKETEYLPAFHRKSLNALLYSIISFLALLLIYHHPPSGMSSESSMLHLSAKNSIHTMTQTAKTKKENRSFLNGAYSTITNEPLSVKSPAELGIPVFHDRPKSSRPGSVFGSSENGAQVGKPLPTNDWYLNLVVGLQDSPGPDEQYEHFAGEENRVYTIPYILDTVGSVVGIRLHYPDSMSYGTVVQSVLVSEHGLTLGTADDDFTRRYQVDEETLSSKLGIGLRWESQQGRKPLSYMRSSILRGMPYGTMEYGQGVAPTIASEITAEMPIIDGLDQLQCGTLDLSSKHKYSTNSTSVLVKEDVELYFPQSDLTWLVFFSRPVYVQCYINPDKLVPGISLPPGAEPANSNAKKSAFQLQVDPTGDSDMDTDEPLLVRIALANNCTSGTNIYFCKGRKARDQSAFKTVLRYHASVYPTSPTVKYAFSNPEGGLTSDTQDSKSAYLLFDWKARSYGGKSVKHLIMYALPHHVDILRQLKGKSSNKVMEHCVRSLHGNACLVKGELWAMEEGLGGLPNFMAPRPSSHYAIPALADALSKDISYSLPDNYMRGAGDTYFSGKMLAKLGRIIVIAQELRGLAETPDEDVSTIDSNGKELSRIIHACKKASLPTEEEVENAIGRLRRGVEVWLSGSSESLFTYDSSWGGLVSCGCMFDGQGCSNVYPNCPSYSDPGLNFGNGFYNDHHFHYGYHIYAAAIVAQYDRDWGRRNFESVLLYIRDIANPSEGDSYFPTFRQKDWYLGNSWASGIALIGGRPYRNGRNQESSSEAIAAYEGIAMYGSVMMKAFGDGRSAQTSDNENANTANQIFNIGRFLAATEIRSADRYWHVYRPKREEVYPDSYTPSVVGMMWDTMCQFQTWFGPAPYLAYGIQLLPLTPISERRDSDQWVRTMYPSFAESCESDDACRNEGWAVLLYASLATLGHPETAMEKTLALPAAAFTSAGGGGHSLTNSLWYIASRPTPRVPFNLDNPSTSIHSKAVPQSEKEKKIDCGCPTVCTQKALSFNANGFTCKERIQWFMANRGSSELGACRQVAGDEYQNDCGACDPELCAEPDTIPDTDKAQPVSSSGCPPCNVDVCKSDLNQCQTSTSPYLCHAGDTKGGCSPTPWLGAHCSACCELFKGCEG